MNYYDSFSTILFISLFFYILQFVFFSIAFIVMYENGITDTYKLSLKRREHSTYSIFINLLKILYWYPHISWNNYHLKWYKPKNVRPRYGSIFNKHCPFNFYYFLAWIRTEHNILCTPVKAIHLSLSIGPLTTHNQTFSYKYILSTPLPRPTHQKNKYLLWRYKI